MTERLTKLLAAAEAVSPGPDMDPPESTEAAKLGDDRSGRFRRGKEASGRRLGRNPAGGP